MCYANKHGQVNEFPVKEARGKTGGDTFIICTFPSPVSFSFTSEHQKDIWNSLFEFPLIETARAVKPERIILQKQWKLLLEESPYRITGVSPLYIHPLTHQTLYTRFYRIQLAEVPKGLANDYTCIDEDRIQEYPVSRLTENYLKSCEKT